MMRLAVDSDLARSSCIGGRFRTPSEHAGLVRLDVPAESQLLENWCWAAIASSLGRYYGASDASQAEIASQVLATDCTGVSFDEIRVRSNAISRLDTALRIVGCYSHWSAGKPLFDRVRFEINMGRPFGARIGWHAGSAHYVLIHGYREDGEKVVVADPLHGSGEYPLEEFPSRYREGGAWTETFWTTGSSARTKGDGLQSL